MLGAFGSLVNSEKAVALGLLVIASTVMVFTGHLTPQEWMEYTKWMAGFYVAGKTLQGGVTGMTTVMAARRGSPAAPDVGNPAGNGGGGGGGGGG